MKKLLLLSVTICLLMCALVGCSSLNVTGSSTSDDVQAPDTSGGESSDVVYPTEISLPLEPVLVVGDTLTLNVTYSPSDTSMKELSWSSSNTSVATINASTGLITAVAEGTTTITVTANAEEGTVTASTTLTVKKSSETTIVVQDQTGDFSLVTSNGTFDQNGNVYTISSAGEYTLSGNLNGEIVVDAGDNDEVTLVLNGVTITYDQNSPILIKNADSVTVKAAKGTENTIYDNRSTKTTDVDEQGEGAISAKCDLKLAATGSLYVEGNYNNGVHTTKDLTVQKLTLKVKAYNNALKGKDSVTIKSGTLEVVSTNGDGIETSDSDVSSKGNQRGTITIGEADTTETPNVTVYAAGDGVQASYNFEMNAGTLTVYNGSYSKYTASNTTVDSFKGIKVKNELIVNGGTITIRSYDDGLHADYGTELENGEMGKGNITINDGIVTIAVTASISRYVSGADAIHADNTLTITGGTIKVASAYEGLEATHIKISGGTTTITASDDGLNAAKKISSTPSITIVGGLVDITMASGDTDGIDSNGTFTMTGGTVITRGAPGSGNSMATGLDCDGTTKITGGTFIQLGARETVPTLTGCYTLNFGSAQGGMGGGMGGGMPGMRWASNTSGSGSYTFSSGTWTISGINVSFSVASGYSYSGCVVYSSKLTSGTSYTISNGTTSYSATAA